MCDQIETWGYREFEDCSVEGSLNGGEKKSWSLQVLCEKTESLKAIHLPALPFLSNSCLSDFLPSFIPFHMVNKYWQNLPALVEVSLHLNFFWVQNFYALFILIWDPPFFFFRLFVFVFILDEHPWYAIDVFVRLLECRFSSAIILQPKKLFILPWFIWKYLRSHFFNVLWLIGRM